MHFFEIIFISKNKFYQNLFLLIRNITPKCYCLRRARRSVIAGLPRNPMIIKAHFQEIPRQARNDVLLKHRVSRLAQTLVFITIRPTFYFISCTFLQSMSLAFSTTAISYSFDENTQNKKPVY
jgi:hypothetical protein